MRALLRVATLALVALAALTTSGAQDARQRRGFAVRLVEPANQEIVFGKTRISAEVDIDDPELVERVEFIVGDETVFVDREAPYECFFDFGDAEKSRVIRAVAYHVEEVQVSDAVITRKMKFSTIERVNRVVLWVSATDDDGNYVDDLERGDFKIYEDGKEQQILEFFREDRAITLGILIDTSGSMRGDKIKAVHGAAGDFVDTLRDIDRAMVIDFDDNVFLIQGLTSDREKLRRAIESVEGIGATSLYDALHAAYRKIGSIRGRRAIVLLSDGEDSSSQFGFKRVVEEAKSNNSLIYTIGLSGEGGGAKKSVLKEFSDVTGGRYFFAREPKDLARIYRKIADELGNQFYLSYSTTNEEWDGHWIKLKVEATRPGIKVRARRGYFAVRQAGAND